jgi:hypothetical protein
MSDIDTKKVPNLFHLPDRQDIVAKFIDNFVSDEGSANYDMLIVKDFLSEAFAVMFLGKGRTRFSDSHKKNLKISWQRRKENRDRIAVDAVTKLWWRPELSLDQVDEWDFIFLCNDVDCWDDMSAPRVMTPEAVKEAIATTVAKQRIHLDDYDAWKEAARPLIEAAKTAGFYRRTEGFIRSMLENELAAAAQVTA